MQFADVAGARSHDRLEQLVADPELKHGVGHQHVAGAAAIVLANADLLITDAHDSVAGHPPADPLLAVSLRMSQLMPDFSVARAEPAFRRAVAQRLMWSLRVVVGHPLIERLLCRLQIPEHLPGVELDSEGAVEALDLAGGGRRGRLGEDVVDAILPADAVEQHFDRGLGVLASEELSVGCQYVLRYFL